MTAQLSFALDNSDGVNTVDNTVYVSGTVSDNQITLVITTTDSASFTPGTMVPFAKAATGSGSLLYLDLTPLGLTQQEYGQLTLTDASNAWAAQLDSSQGQLICFTPAPGSPVTIGSSDNVTLNLNNFTLAKMPSTPTVGLSVYCYRVTGVTNGNAMWLGNFSVSVQYPPDKNDKDLHQAIAVTVAPNEVVNSISGYPNAQNNLVLQFGPGPSATQIVANKDTEFKLSFVYATDTDGFGALLNPTTGVQPPMAVVAGVGASSWGINPNLTAASPYWTLKPPAGSPILGTGPSSVVSFNINNLVTTFKPGPTLITVSYDNVPGYQAGTYSILIEKDAHVAITTPLSVSPAKAVVDSSGYAKVTLSWATTDATQLTLQPVGQDVTGQTSFQATIADTTPFTLIAEGVRPGNVDNTAFSNATAVVEPVINSFKALPSAIYQADFPGNVALSWNVALGQGQTLTLVSSATGVDSSGYGSPGGVSKTLQVPQMLTLQGGKSASGGPETSRSVIVPGFTVTPSVYNIAAAGSAVAAPANGAFVAVAVPASSQVTILSTATYKSFGTVGVGKNPQGIAFSPDGNTMYVANQGDGTVSVIGVQRVQGVNPYQLNPITTVTVGGAPQQIAVGADGSAWVTVDAGSSNGSVVKIAAGSNTATPVAVGVNPRGVAVTPSAGLVFVANQGSNTVSVITNGIGGPAATTPIAQLGAPNGVAVSPDGGTLLVTCTSPNSVVAVNVAYYVTAPRKTYPLQLTPTLISILPSGAYAVITSASGKAALLFNYQTGTGTPTTLPAQPQGLGITPDDGMAIVAIPSQNSIAVLAFANYAQVGAPVACGGGVTNVAVTPDAGTALVWYNASTSIEGGTGGEMPGLQVYSVANHSASPALTNVALYDLAISPGANDDTFYVAPTASTAVSVYTTSSLQLATTIPIPAARGAKKRQPMCVDTSSDGTTLFVLTNDGNNKYSIVAFQVNLQSQSFTQVADVQVFTTSQPPLAVLLAAAPDGSAAYATASTQPALYAVQQSGGSYQAATPLSLVSGSFPSAIAVLPDGSKAYVLVTIGLNLAFCVVDTAAWTMQPVWLPDADFSSQLRGIAVMPDGSRLLGADSVFAGIRVFDAASLRIIQTITWSSGVQMPYGVAVAPDGSRIYCAAAGSADLVIAEQVQPS